MKGWIYAPAWIIGAFFLVVGLGLMYANKPESAKRNPCTLNAAECYSIQGMYSKPGCPGQHTETVSLDGYTFFLGCFGESK